MPTPVIASIAPSSVPVKTAADLVATGSGFSAGAVARWNGIAQPTVITSQQATTFAAFSIDPDEAAPTGVAQVVVVNPDQSVSNAVPVLVTGYPGRGVGRCDCGVLYVVDERFPHVCGPRRW